MFFRINLPTQPIRQTKLCVDVCALDQVPSRGLWRQKRKPNVSDLESRTGGYGDKSAGQMFLRIYVHAHNVADQHIYGCVYYIEFQAGGYGD